MADYRSLTLISDSLKMLRSSIGQIINQDSAREYRDSRILAKCGYHADNISLLSQVASCMPKTNREDNLLTAILLNNNDLLQRPRRAENNDEKQRRASTRGSVRRATQDIPKIITILREVLCMRRLAVV